MTDAATTDGGEPGAPAADGGTPRRGLRLDVLWVGAGIGVTAFGVLSDVIREALPASAPPHQSVRYALMGAAISFLIPAFFYWRASKHVQREIQEFERA